MRRYLCNPVLIRRESVRRKRGITGRFPQTHMTRALRSASGKAPHLAVLIQPITVWLRESSQLCNVPCVWAVLTPTGKSMHYHQGGFVWNLAKMSRFSVVILLAFTFDGGRWKFSIIWKLHYSSTESVNIHGQNSTEKKWSRYMFSKFSYHLQDNLIAFSIHGSESLLLSANCFKTCEDNMLCHYHTHTFL